jgi:hypothetical protein
MATFEELSQKGWKNLTAEERAEYQKLKPVEADPNEDRIKKLEDMVSRLTVDNTNLKQESAKLQEGWQEYVPPAQRNKTATLKIYRENASANPAVITKVITFKDSDWNEETHKFDKLVFTVTLRYDSGETKEIQMAADILTKIREIEEVEIIKEDRRTLRKVDGYVVVPNRDNEGYPKRELSASGGYGHSIGANKVPLEVFTVKSDVTVKRKNGQEFQMDSAYLNL